ncbi:efflux RND transporter periplasmic adaptor subunit [Aquimarina sp. W85]|uniref:efflux RND transporter periplasmic adaptor subunit n=1 Tax=Aquimarina rhodophyticola TaxID=3342246 RepID=UPI00366B0BCA
MKILCTISAFTLLLLSCGDSKNISVEKTIENGNLSEMRAKRAEVVQLQQTINNELQQLDAAIAQKDTVQKLPLVTTVKATDTLFKHYLELQGNTETKKNLVLYPETSGILTRVYVEDGQRVKKGQLLAKIDDGGLSQQLSQVEVQTELAKTTFDRQKRLWEQKIGSEIQYLQAKTTYEAQQNAVAQIKRQLAKTTINAPFSGIIDDVITEQGSVVAPGQTEIIRIVNLEDMYIEVEVPESYLSQITEEKEVLVDFPVLGKTIETKVRQVGNYINPNNRSFMVEVAIPNKNKSIKPNLTAKVKINDYTNEQAILIPQSILSENADGEQYIYITGQQDQDGVATAKRTIVKTGRTQGDLIEIIEGINANDHVIKEGARSVKDGQKVKILN